MAAASAFRLDAIARVQRLRAALFPFAFDPPFL
jgi:hypothetical protein